MMERAVRLSSDGAITLGHVPTEMMADGLFSPGMTERERVMAALAAGDGNQTHAAKVLGIARRTLVNRIEEHDLPRPRKK
jgi:transcriptional regulator of acetoin/glycerol metabolism